MIPIAALLNVDTDDEEREPELVQAQLLRLDRQTSSVTSNACTSSDEMEDEPQYSPTGDDEDAAYEQVKRDLQDNETSSLLGALTLQKLRFASTPTSAGEDAAAIEPAATAASAYLRMDSLTHPEPENNQQNEEISIKPLTPGRAARAARRRSTRSLFPGTTDEDRRAKQRMIVKRCYYKKINTINDLRDQVQQLEHVFHSLLEEQEAQRGEDEDPEHGEPLDRYIETVKDKEVLRHENQRLRKLADEYYMKNQGRLRVLLDANRKEMTLFTPAITEE